MTQIPCCDVLDLVSNSKTVIVLTSLLTVCSEDSSVWVGWFEPHYLQHSSSKPCVLSAILSQGKKSKILSFIIVPIHIYILGKFSQYFQSWISGLGMLPDHYVSSGIHQSTALYWQSAMS